MQTASAFKTHVALLDIDLPNLNGFEVARNIRAQPWGKSTVLIALTGWVEDETGSNPVKPASTAI